MHRRWLGVVAMALAAAILITGGLTASANAGNGGGTSPTSIVDSATSGLKHLASLVGLDDADSAAPGTLDDGAELLPQAGITLDQAIAAAQAAAPGSLGEVDLEHFHGTLVFNVDIGDKDVKVDATTGTVLNSSLDN